MLVVEPTGQRDCMATSGQNISKAEKKRCQYVKNKARYCRGYYLI